MTAPTRIPGGLDVPAQSGIFTMTEVTHFAEVFYMKRKSQAALSNVMKLARELGRPLQGRTARRRKSPPRL